MFETKEERRREERENLLLGQGLALHELRNLGIKVAMWVGRDQIHTHPLSCCCRELEALLRIKWKQPDWKLTLTLTLDFAALVLWRGMRLWWWCNQREKPSRRLGSPFYLSPIQLPPTLITTLPPHLFKYKPLPPPPLLGFIFHSEFFPFKPLPVMQILNRIKLLLRSIQMIN